MEILTQKIPTLRRVDSDHPHPDDSFIEYSMSHCR